MEDEPTRNVGQDEGGTFYWWFDNIGFNKVYTEDFDE